MTPWIEAIALWMADFYLAATILLMIACAAWCFIKQPARRMAISGGTLVSLLVAAVLCQSTSRPRLDPRRLFVRQEKPTVRVGTAESRPAESRLAGQKTAEPSLPEISFAPRPAPSQQADLAPPPDIVAEPEVASENPSRAEIDMQTIAGVAVLLFLVGAVLVASRLALGAWQALRLVRLSLTAPPAMVDELQAIVGGGTRLPRLRLNAQLVTPVATGALRPTIVLPDRFGEGVALGELRAVLGHEWAHIQNGDLWLLALDRCLFPLLWAHPAYLWLRRRMRQDQEFLADAAAASLIGPADYAAQLVDWARQLAGVKRIVVSNAVGIWERPSGFALRISTILDQADRTTPRCSGRVRGTIVACLAALSLAAASISVRPPIAESAPPEAKAAPEETKAEPAKTEMLAVGTDEIGGTCVDEQKKPVASAQLLLYVTNFQEMTQRLIQQTSTDAKGRFKFTHLAPKSHTGDNDVVVARRRGLATFASYTDSRGKPLEIAMRKAANFRGTVRDGKGNPLAGAQVSFATDRIGINCLLRPVEGLRCARTDAKGEFSVDDLEEFTYVEQGPPPGWRGGWGTMGSPSMNVVCPGYVETRVHYPKVPGSADAVLAEAARISGQVAFGKTGQPASGVVVTLQSGGPHPHVRSIAETGPDGRYRFDTLPEGTFALWVSPAPGDLNAPFVEHVEARRGRSTQAPLMRLVKCGEIRGRVVDDVAGRPAVGITVNLQGLLEQEGPARGFFASTKSDGLGQYRFTGLPSGKFNVFLDKTGADVTAAALESLPVECNQMTTAPPIRLIRGGVLKGRVIDDATGKPLVLHDGEKLGVRIYGPTRPWSGGACHYAIVNKDGTFEMRLPPGQSSLLLTTLSGGMLFNPTGNDGGDVTVRDGGEVHVEYHVTRMQPPKDADDNKTQTEKPVSVHVVDAQGRPAVGATVIACARPDKSELLEKLSASTNAAGVASLDVRGNKCRVLAFTKNGSFAGQIAASGEAREVTIRLAPAAEITGRLVTRSLMPVSGRRMLCYLTEPGDTQTTVALETQTGSRGEFLFTGVPVGAKAQLLTVRPGGYLFHYDVPFVVTRLGSIDRGDLLDDLLHLGFTEKPRDSRTLPAGEPMDRDDSVDAELMGVYGLGAGKNIKRVVEPFPKGRSRWTAPEMPGAPPGKFQPALSLYFYNGRFLNEWHGNLGRVRWKATQPLIFLLEHCGLGAAEIDGPRKLVETTVEGDFVIRVGVPTEKLIPELEQILCNECHLRIALNFVEESQNVLVAGGNFDTKPTDGPPDLIAIYADARPAGLGRNAGDPTGGLDEFLRDVGNHISRRIVNDVSTPPKRVLWWNQIVYSEGARSAEFVLKHITEQTGLTFREERRKVRVLRVEPRQGQAADTNP